jgi:sugar/nucleoside kinase (ribokinase family)
VTPAYREVFLTREVAPWLSPTLRYGSSESVDIFLPNQAEVLAITKCETVGRALEHLVSAQLRVVVKLGADGAATLAEGQIVQKAPIPVALVDTTGTGDSFDAGFIYGYLAGWSLERSLALATVCGALSTRDIGGTTAQPTLAEALNGLKNTG